MAPIKFEKKIKEIFDAREIEPSGDAWEKVASQLASSPVKRSLRPWHYWVAASIAFIVFVVGWSVRKSGQPVMDEIPLVEQQKLPEPLDQPLAVPVAERQAKISPVATEDGKPGQQVYETIVSPIEEPEFAAVQEPEPPAVLQPEATGDKLFDEKISEVLAQVGELEATKEGVSEAEVDSLLRAAQGVLLANEEFQKEARLNGASLLAEVEGELEESFRDRVFEKLKRGFIKVRTAVADRNN